MTDLLTASMIVLPSTLATAWPMLLVGLGLIGAALYAKSGYEERQRSRRLALTLEQVTLARERLARRQARFMPLAEPVPPRPATILDSPPVPRLVDHLTSLERGAGRLLAELAVVPEPDLARVRDGLLRHHRHLSGLLLEVRPEVKHLREELAPRNGERGFLILGPTLLLLGLMGLLSLAVLHMAALEVKASKNHLSHTQSRASAESGVEIALWRATEGETASFELDLPAPGGHIAVTVTDIGGNQYAVDSRSLFEGARSRVRATIAQGAAGAYYIVPGSYAEVEG